MDPPGDDSPLWGSGQYSFPDFNRHQAQQQTQLPSLQPPHQQHEVSTWQNGGSSQPGSLDPSAYEPYQAGSSEGGAGYVELKAPDSVVPEVVEADSTITDSAIVYQHAMAGYQADLIPVPHGGYQPSYLPQLPFSNGNNVLLPEGATFLPPPGPPGGPGQRMSPDGGYHSPGPEYYSPYQLPPQGYMVPSPYQNPVVSPPDCAVIKYEDLEVKQETSEPVPYSQQIEGANSGQKMNDNKPIIHENILIKPAVEPVAQLQPYQQHPQAQLIQLQHPIHFRIEAQLPHHQHQQPLEVQHVQYEIHQLPQHFQEKTPTKQSQRGKSRKRSYPTIVVDDQQPSTSKAPLPTTPVAHFRVIQAFPPDGNPQTPAEEDAEPMPELEDGSPVRRSARPSVIERSDYECNKCGNFFARQCGLTQHQKWIHAERKFPCERCGKKFPSGEDLAKHAKRHDQQDKPFKCPVCPKQFCHKNDLRRHMYRHEDTTPFMCDVCPKCFIRKDHLLAHQQSHDRREKRTQERYGNK